jgi:GxxExxY protein
MVENWEKLHSEYLGDFRIFRIRTDSSRSPRTGNVHHFFVLEAPDWVNVIPLTPKGNVVMIYQYRHGTEEVTLEVPGGMVDAADGDPAVSAVRELREETGYAAGEIVHLGTVAPNPAFMDNRCHSYLALDVRRVAEVQLDGAEDIAFVEVPLADIPALIRDGKITHSLTITAFHHLGLYQEAKNLTQRSPSAPSTPKDYLSDKRDDAIRADKNLTQRTPSAPSTQKDNPSDENEIARQVVDAAYHIHQYLGSGLLESAYEAILSHDLEQRGFKVARQIVLPVYYGSVHVDAGYRIDLMINDKVIIELKSVDALMPVHQKQLLTYLKLADKRLGLLINFGDDVFKRVVKRVVNGL